MSLAAEMYKVARQAQGEQAKRDEQKAVEHYEWVIDCIRNRAKDGHTSVRLGIKQPDAVMETVYAMLRNAEFNVSVEPSMSCGIEDAFVVTRQR